MFERTPLARSRAAAKANIGRKPSGMLPGMLSGLIAAFLSLLVGAPTSFAGEADSPSPAAAAQGSVASTQVSTQTATHTATQAAAHAARAALLSTLIIEPAPVVSSIKGGTSAIASRGAGAPHEAPDSRIIRNLAERHTPISRIDPEWVQSPRHAGAATYVTLGGATAGGYSSLTTGTRSACYSGYTSPGFSLRYRDEHLSVELGGHSYWPPSSCHTSAYSYRTGWVGHATTTCTTPRYYESSWGSPMRIDPHLDRCRSVTVVKDPYRYDRKPIICHDEQVKNLKPYLPARVAVSKKAAGK